MMTNKRKKAFYHVAYSEDSQFDFFGGELSCTYCCLAATEFLYKNSHLYELNPKDLVTSLDEITKRGVKLDMNIGLTSADEVFPVVPAFQKDLELGDSISGQLADPDSFRQLLIRIEQKGQIACVLTKPVETILIFHNPKSPYPFVIYDSHPRNFGEGDYGAAFYFFLDRESCRQHLRELFPIKYKFKNRNPSYELKKSYNLFEGTLIHKKGVLGFKRSKNMIILRPQVTQVTRVKVTKTPKPTRRIKTTTPLRKKVVERVDRSRRSPRNRRMTKRSLRNRLARRIPLLTPYPKFRF